MIIKQINGYEDYYISENGEVFRKMKPWLATGYKDIKTSDGKHHNIHRLVAKHFIENPNNLPIVNHINGDRLDNRVENLEWVTQQENLSKHYESTGDTPKKYFKECELYCGDKLVSEFQDIKQASKYAEEHFGVKETMLRKHKQSKQCKIIVK